MKRSRINDIMTAADEMMRSFGFTLPPFAYWNPEEFRARVNDGSARRIADARLGWDITDYGQGDSTGSASSCSRCETAFFPIWSAERHGLRGKAPDQPAGPGHPMHTHFIKSRGHHQPGRRDSAVELFGSDANGNFDGEKGATVLTDGLERQLQPGEVLNWLRARASR